LKLLEWLVGLYLRKGQLSRSALTMNWLNSRRATKRGVRYEKEGARKRKSSYDQKPEDVKEIARLVYTEVAREGRVVVSYREAEITGRRVKVDGTGKTRQNTAPQPTESVPWRVRNTSDTSRRH